MRTFIVGDVHGHPQLVEALLREAGALDADGRRVRDVRTVQVGDLANCVAADAAGDMACLERASAWFDVVLVGNHEHPYFGRECARFAGFDFRADVREALVALERDGVYQPAALVGETLVTHAGVARDWLLKSAKAAYEVICDAWRRDKADQMFNRIGWRRGGRSERGGILWADIAEEKAPFRQVFGHTPMRDLAVEYAADGEWVWRHVDWGGKSFGRLAGIWLDEHGLYDGEVRVQEP